MHAWLDFITELQSAKKLDIFVPDQLLAVNAETVAFQMEENNYKK